MTVDGSDNLKSARLTSGLAKQIFISLVASTASCHAGIYGSWMAPMGLFLTKEGSPVGIMTKDELAYVGSMPSYAGIFLALLMAYVGKTLGRKPPIIIAGVVSSISAVILTFASSKMHLYIGRTLGCIIMASISFVPMYISESVHGSIRGTMMSLCILTMNGGVLVSNALGPALGYKIFNACLIVVPITYSVLLLWLPETPHFLIEKSRPEAAKNSLLWSRGGDHSAVELELEEIVTAFDRNKGDKMGLRQILQTKASILVLVISCTLYVLQSFSGIQAVLNYAGLIFEEADSSLDTDTCLIITAVILTVGCSLNLLLMDRLGRKTLLYISLVGSTISLSALSAFLYVKMNGADVARYGWIPIGSLGSFVVAYGIGVATIPGAIANEISPNSIRPIVNGSAIFVILILMAVVIQSFPYLDDNFGLYSVFAFPAICNVLGIIFTYFMVPETKGKSMLEIDDYMKNMF